MRHCRASGDVGVLALHRTELEQLVGPLRVLERNIRCVLLKQHLLAHLGERQRKQMCHMCREQSFAPGTSIIDQGQPGQAFYIVIEGVLSVRVTQGDGGSERLRGSSAQVGRSFRRDVVDGQYRG